MPNFHQDPPNVPPNPVPPSPPKSGGGNVRALLLGGLVPVILFTVIEEVYGTLWGLIAGMVFGVGEILWEKFRLGKVDPITWIANGLILFLGGISLLTTEGVWFKLQPAILEAGFAGLLIGSVVIGKPFMVLMARKQKLFEKLPPGTGPYIEQCFNGFSVRLGIFFLGHALIAVWAALYWSTRQWAMLKGIGFTITLFVYCFVEALVLRRRLLAKRAALASQTEG